MEVSNDTELLESLVKIHQRLMREDTIKGIIKNLESTVIFPSIKTPSAVSSLVERILTEHFLYFEKHMTKHPLLNIRNSSDILEALSLLSYVRKVISF